MINLILYISILVSAVLVVYYFFDNIRRGRILARQNKELKICEAKDDEHRGKMLLRTQRDSLKDEASFTPDKSKMNEPYQEIIDTLNGILGDASLKKQYKEDVTSLRNELLLRGN